MENHKSGVDVIDDNESHQSYEHPVLVQMTNSSASSNASNSSSGSTHRQIPSYDSAEFSSSSASEPVTPPDSRLTTVNNNSGTATNYTHAPPVKLGEYHGNFLQPNLFASPIGSGVGGFQSSVLMPTAKTFAPSAHQPYVITPPGEPAVRIRRSATSPASASDPLYLLDPPRLHTQAGNQTGTNRLVESFPSSPARFLFTGEVRAHSPPPSNGPSHQRMPSFLQAETTDDKFPILVRRESSSRPTKVADNTVSTARQSFSGGATGMFDRIDSFDQGGRWNPLINTSQVASSTAAATNVCPPNASHMMSDHQVHHYSPPLQSPPSIYRNSHTVQHTATADSGSQLHDNVYTHHRGLSLPAQYSSQYLSSSTNTGGSVTTPMQPVLNPTSVTVVASPPPYRTIAPAANGRRQSKRSEQEAAAASRFANVSLESIRDEIFSLCRDQHGCRYLQRRLEERNATYQAMIFNETARHVVELMTDPFGNYLCQKLLEYATDEQRTTIVRTAAPDMVKIALNQHGTRALQKMIQYVNTPEQVGLIVNALKANVVKLIQDLNGNHVIQKCLNRLSIVGGSQFIFDAVCENCVTVGTHKHGCCVLQRCIDHATEDQKKQLVNQITVNSFALVQDQFGNYVTQYVLDLGRKEFSEPLIRQFAGNICILSVQKFSSNVIEKCLRIAEPDTATMLIEELVTTTNLDQLLRDSYANYVIQTALDCAQPSIRQRLVENIRPIMPSIRSTPYGRRIQSKLSSGASEAGPALACKSSSRTLSVSMGQPPAQTFAPPVGELDW
jgi:hypothetical protein